MKTKFARFQYLPGVLSVMLLAACSSPPVLIAKSAAVPVGVDISGFWKVQGGIKTRVPEHAEGIREELIRVQKTQRSRRKRSSSGVSAHVFLQFGRNLKITQTEYGIFISYDRSVVDEYTFGENRTVEIGPIEALRVSGWEGDEFVVETLDDSGTTLYETWSLTQNGQILLRKIRISKGEKENFYEEQRFDRQEK